MNNPKKFLRRNLYKMDQKISKIKEESLFYKLIVIPYESLIKMWSNNFRKNPKVKIKKHHIMCLLIPKVASNSIKKWCKELRKMKEIQNFPKGKHFIFTFVRNPYDRIVSCYEQKVNRKKDKIYYRDFDNFLSKHPKIKKGQTSFKEFVKILSKVPDYKADQHIRSQYTFLTDKKGRLISDFVGKSEHLNQDCKKVCKILGIKNPPKFPHKNKSRRKKDYKRYYDKETRELVQKRYQKDLEIFGYKF